MGGHERRTLREDAWSRNSHRGGPDPLTSAANAVDRGLRVSRRRGGGDVVVEPLVGLDRLAPRDLHRSCLTCRCGSGVYVGAPRSVVERPGPGLLDRPYWLASEPVRRLDRGTQLAPA